jgi:hypothetical protein
VTIICTIPQMVRVGLGLLVIGFALGLLTGYRAGISAGAPVPAAEPTTDVRAHEWIVDLERSTIPCTSIPSAWSWSGC